MERAEQARLLKTALFFGRHRMVEELLDEAPGLGRDDFGLACALYDAAHVRDVLARDPGAATRIVGVRRPMAHLAFSRFIHGRGRERDMIAVAEALVAAGGDVDDHFDHDGDPATPLSCLYGALGHADNIVLARWLLEHGADPNDGESLYHSTELGHRDGLALLIEHGARPEGTNALARALDFDDIEAVRMLLAAGADPNEGAREHPSGEAPFAVPALHQAARRMRGAETVALLLDAGADPSMRHRGLTPYSMARVYGNADAARLIAEAGGDTALGPEEEALAAAADGREPDGAVLDPAGLPEEYRDLVRSALHLPGRLAHLRRLAALGLECDRPDGMGVTPVQAAGWEGLPDVMAWLLSLKPDLSDLSHVNGYGGDLLSTIVHGSENCPARSERDHVACLRLALERGAPLPRRAPLLAAAPDVAGFLADWAEAHPGQVVEEGPC